MKKVAIIGGGIAGLATAYYLQALGTGRAEYMVFETADRFGGKIVSSHENGFVVEGGPDSFLTTKPAALELVRALGLGDQLIGTNDAGRKVFVWSRGKLRAMPDGVMLIIPTRIMPFVRSPLISWPGKLRMGMELFVPVDRNGDDESLAHFVRRRLGSEALDRIAEPMIAGIYVADAGYLSLKSTFPRFLEMEQKYGGLLRGVLAQRLARRSGSHSKGTPPMFMTLKGGLQDLVDAIVRRLDPDTLRRRTEVMRVISADSGYELTLASGAQIHADEVVFASPAYATASMIQELDPILLDSLRQIRYVSTATVSLGYKRSELTHSLNGFGFVVPRSEKRKILACTWSSTKFSSRAADGYALVRAFVGGAHYEELADRSIEDLLELARTELREMMGITAQPVLCQVYRWPKANPQYAVGHQKRILGIEEMAAQHKGLHLAGGAYHGVGIPDCIEDGKRAAERILGTIYE